MPRGRRKKQENYEEELAILDTQIAETAKKLQSLKEKRKARVKKEEEDKDADKWEKIKNSPYSVDELLSFVQTPK